LIGQDRKETAMANHGGVVIKVKTEQLISVSGEVEQKIRRLQQAFANMEQTVSASRNYWEGDGASAYQAAYRRKTDIIRTALKRFQENVTDLREIAGVYEQSEQEIVANNAELSTAGIV